MSPTPTDSDSDHADVVVLPPILHGGSVVVAVAAKALFGGSLPASSMSRAIGGLFVLLGLAAGILFTRAFRRTGQHPNPRTPTQELVFDGLYRYTRNPAYVSIAMIQIGLAFLLGNPWLLVVLVPVLPVMHYAVILPEEAYLERKFGEEYLAYKRRVRRWL